MRGQVGSRGGSDSKRDLHNRPDSVCPCEGPRASTDSRNGKTVRVSEQTGWVFMLPQDPGVTRQDLEGQRRLEFCTRLFKTCFAFHTTLFLYFTLEAEHLMCGKGGKPMPRYQLQPLDETRQAWRAAGGPRLQGFDRC